MKLSLVSVFGLLLTGLWCVVAPESGHTDQIKERYYGVIYNNGNFISVEHPDAWSTYIKDINDSGVMAGWYDTAVRQYGFIYDGADFTVVDVPGSVTCSAEGINNNGDIVGWYDDGDNQRHGFVRYADGSYDTVNFPSTYHYSLTDINNALAVVGWYKLSESDDYIYGFKLDDINNASGYTTLQYPGATRSNALSINDSEQIAGFYTIIEDNVAEFQYGMMVSQESGYVKIRFESGEVADLTGAGGINNNGVIAGWYEYGGSRHGFVYDGTTYQSASKPGENYTMFTGINNQGVAVGVVSRFETIEEDDNTCFVRTVHMK